MRKKVIIGLIVVAIVILIMIVFFGINNSDNAIILRGNIIFGNDYCPKNEIFYEDSDHQMNALTVISPYTCKLCQKKYEYPQTPTPKICSSCATITGRCMDCGKLQK
jgi:hypothetical protein